MPIKPIATRIVKKLVDAGHIAYIAGGWVRDWLMKHPSDDIDIATSASVEAIQALFPKTVPVGVAFGIIIVVEEGHPFEVATFRKERGYLDGRRPTTIEPASPEEDAQRRDFTINGMFFDPLKDQLIDFVGGQEDLKKGVIRAIGDPHERFLEDRLRMMRAVRYSTRFHFPIDPKTVEAILAHASSLLPAVAMERVWQEFKKMAQFSHFNRGLVMLHRLNLLATIFPDLKALSIEEVEKRTAAIPFFPKNTPPIAELLELFPAASLEKTIELCDLFKLSKKEREVVAFLHRAQSMLQMPEQWQKKLELVEWAHFYAHAFCEISLGVIAAHLEAKQRSAFLEEHALRREGLHTAIARIQTQSPLVSAQDLMQEGIAPGVQMGALLKEAERLAINQKLEDQKEVLDLLKKSSLWKK